MTNLSDSPRTSWVAACGLLIAVTAARLWPLITCGGHCVVDFAALYPHGTLASHLLAADVRLNSWILAWDTHALATHAAGLFDAEALYPARGVLTGSEHLLGIAVPLMPVAAAGAGAVVLHRLALVASFALTGLTTFALVRWLTASTWAATAAGILAILAPWRIGELSHLQLLSTSWVALLWLLWLRTMLQGPRITAIVVLMIALVLQLLSSYYLAYYVLASLAVITVVALAFGNVARKGLVAVCAVGALSLAVLAIVSQPYLARGVGNTLALHGGRLPDPGLVQAMSSLAPSWATPASALTAGSGAYAPPVLWLLAALLSLLPAMRLRLRDQAGDQAGNRSPSRHGADGRIRIATLALWLTVVFAFVMSMGDTLELGGFRLPMPASLASAWIPGYADLRAPLRWGILVNLALPVLAGIGLAGLRRVRRWPNGLGTALIVLLALNVSWRPLPTGPLWSSATGRAQAYEELGRLPAGPVLEIPWPLNASSDAVQSSAYMLAAAGHRHPLLNGYTAYVPPSYDYLRRIAARLPAKEALDKLVALARLRWIVVHEDLLSPARRQPWRLAAMSRTLIRTYEGRSVKIYEVASTVEPGSLTDALLSGRPRTKTFTGLARTPLTPAEGAGRIEATPPAVAEVFDGGFLNLRLPIRIRNDSPSDWPGFDNQNEGLVLIRYRFDKAPDATSGRRTARIGAGVLEATAPLDIDIPAGHSVLVPVGLQGRIGPGSYELTLELVQKLGTGYRLLPVHPMRAAITLLPAGRGS